MAADRAEGMGLAATEKESVASPWPFFSPASTTQVESVVADHVQSRAVVIVSEPCPPLEVNDNGAAATLIAQRSAEGAVTLVSVFVQRAAASAAAAATIHETAREGRR